MIITKIKSIFCILFIGMVYFTVGAQDSKISVDSLLSMKSKEIPALNEKISISVSDVPIEEFLRGVANTAGLNLDVQPALEYKVVNNFNNVQVQDILKYVCRQFQLQLEITGNIISIFKPMQSAMEASEKVKWNESTGLVTFDFSNVPIEDVVREITQKTKNNVILAPGAGSKLVSVFIDSKPLNSALEKLAYANSMSVKQTEDNFYILQQEVIQQEQSYSSSDRGSRRSGSGERRRTSTANNNNDFLLDLQVFNADSIDILAENAPIPVILNELSEKAQINYFLSEGTDGQVTTQIKGASLDELFTGLFGGTKISFKKNNGIYFIGEKNSFDFNEHRVIHLQNRSIDKLEDFIPADMTKDLSVKEFPELNSLLVTGAAYQIDELENFIKQIDQVVPVVLIEVIIMYVSNSKTVSTGITAGLGEEPATTGGTVLSGVDMTLNANSINKIINEMGWINLGKVNSNFYISLKALEEQGVVDLESTPKLSTLNGTEATLSIGNTEYYLEEQSNLYGAQNPQLTTSQTYKAINAELKLKIKPVISDNGQITLDIEVSQSDFTERISKTAPPGSVNRNFTSKIRIKDQEMILLGGLTEKKKSDSGTGTPLLSRIPVIKWFFSSRTRVNSESKLSVLIKPTIIN